MPFTGPQAVWVLVGQAGAGLPEVVAKPVVVDGESVVLLKEVTLADAALDDTAAVLEADWAIDVDGAPLVDVDTLLVVAGAEAVVVPKPVLKLAPEEDVNGGV